MKTVDEALSMPLDQIRQSTFDNRSISLANISHAHLSNCYWYSLFFQNPKILQLFNQQIEKLKKYKNIVVKGQDYEKAAILRDEEKVLMNKIENLKVFPINEHMTPTSHMLYRRALKERFNGEILPYEPHPNFEEEIKILLEMEMLSSTATGYDIIYNDVKIGKIDMFNSRL